MESLIDVNMKIIFENIISWIGMFSVEMPYDVHKLRIKLMKMKCYLHQIKWLEKVS